MAKTYKRFKKPTPAQVEEYGLSIAFPIDGEEFCDFYESKGWKIGTSPMKSWEACVRTWKRHWEKRTGRKLPKLAIPDTSTVKTADQMVAEIEGDRK